MSKLTPITTKHNNKTLTVSTTHRSKKTPIKNDRRSYDEGRRISFYTGIEAISQLLKNWLFPKPTKFRQWSIFERKLKTLTFPIRLVCNQEWLKKHGFTTLEDERIQYVLPHIEGRLLDIGCGENNLVKKWGNGIGVDVYPWPGVDIVCDTTHLPFDNEHFDTVSFIASLNHIPQRLVVLQEAARVLKPDGRLVFTMIDEKVGWLCHKIIWWDKDQHERGMEHGEKYGLSNAYIMTMLRETGFALIAQKKVSFFGLNNIYVAQKNTAW